MKRILVGADGSDGAADAIRWSAGLAARTGAELVVMTGFVPTESELPPHRVETLLAEQEQQLESWSQVARSSDVEVRTVLERGDPRPGILAVAEREGADLIVVGRVGRSAGPGLLHLGSMVEWLAHHSDLPVAVIGGDEAGLTRSVLVGVDGSAGSRDAVRWIRDALVGDGLRVLAATVRDDAEDRADTTAEKPDGEPGARQGLEQRIRDDLAAELDVDGVDLEATVLTGRGAADVLLEAAKQHEVDLIVVGTRGLGGFIGLRIGGVALRTLHQADRPVVLVPSAER